MVCILHVCSKLLGGGIESMAITEAFGGEDTTLPLYWPHWPFGDKAMKSGRLKRGKFISFTEFRTGKTQLSHTLCGEWITNLIYEYTGWMKQHWILLLLLRLYFICAVPLIFRFSAFLLIFSLSSDVSAAWGRRLHGWKGHLHRHRTHFVSLCLVILCFVPFYCFSGKVLYTVVFESVSSCISPSSWTCVHPWPGLQSPRQTEGYRWPISCGPWCCPGQCALCPCLYQ